MIDIKIDEIIIQPQFEKFKCNTEKIEKEKRFYKEFGTMSFPVVLSEKNVLIDGYSRYLAAKDLGLIAVPCVHKYRLVFGVFPDNEKEYCWKNPENLNVKEGDQIVVDTKNGEQIITVTRFKKSYKRGNRWHKNVLRIYKP